MASPARVHSLEALDVFRARLIVYLDHANRILDDAQTDVVRTRAWLETDAQEHWRRQIRERTKRLEQAEAELLTARLSGEASAIQDRRHTVERARRHVDEAEQGLRRVRRWLAHYEPEVESHTKVIHHLRQVLAHDMAKANAYLAGAADTLADYAQVRSPTSPEPPQHGPQGSTDASTAAPGGALHQDPPPTAPPQ